MDTQPQYYEDVSYPQFLAVRQTEGYTTVVLGHGLWVGNTRVQLIAACHHPDGRVHTWETAERDVGPRSLPYGTCFNTSAEYETHCERWRIASRSKHFDIADEIRKSRV